MKKNRLCACLLAAATALLPMTAPLSVYAQTEHEVEVPELSGDGTYAEGQALVAMTATQAAALAKEGTVSFDHKIEVEECWDFGEAEDAGSKKVRDYVALVSSDTYSTEELMEIVAEKYYVDAVAPNSELHLCDVDPMAAYQWHLNGTDALTTQSPGIRKSAMNVTSLTQPVVAVVDTGVDYTNEDLKDSMWVNPYESMGLKGIYGYDFAESDADPMDTYGHGTHCAGTIAAQTGNGIGISGISDAKIMALKVAKDEEMSFYTDSVIGALEYIIKAQELGVNIAAVNCSWGGGYDTGDVLNIMMNKIGANGALIVFAAGNDGTNWDAIPGRMRQTPYDLESQYVVIVGASNEYDERAYFSDYSASQVAMFAPGSNILSTSHENKFLPQVWTAGKRSEMTSYFWSGGDLNGLYTAEMIEGLESDYSASIVYDADRGYADGADGSIRYTVRYNGQRTKVSNSTAIFSGNREQAGFIYADVTDLNLDTNATYYVSVLMSEAAENGELVWSSFEKESKPGNANRFITIGDRTYMALIGINTVARNATTYYFDDFAISKANPDVQQFGKYDIESGSSMAAPMISAAIAVLKGAQPSKNAGQIRSQLMDCTRTVDALEDVCITGGVLDLGQIKVLASSLSLNKTSATLRYGSTLKLKATVAPSNLSNAKLKWSSSNTRYATVTSAGKVKAKKAGIGKTVKITVKTTDGSGLKKTCKVKIKAKAKS